MEYWAVFKMHKINLNVMTCREPQNMLSEKESDVNENGRVRTSKI